MWILSSSRTQFLCSCMNSFSKRSLHHRLQNHTTAGLAMNQPAIWRKMAYSMMHALSSKFTANPQSGILATILWKWADPHNSWKLACSAVMSFILKEDDVRNISAHNDLTLTWIHTGGPFEFSWLTWFRVSSLDFTSFHLTIFIGLTNLSCDR